MIYHQYIPSHNLVLTIFYDDVSSHEFLDFIELIVHHDFEPGSVRGLSIFCKNTNFKNLSARAFFQGGRKMHAASYRQGGKNAIVAKTRLAYGFSRAYQVATELQNIDETKVYHEQELADALLWLGVSDLAQSVQQKITACEQGITPPS